MGPSLPTSNERVTSLTELAWMALPLQNAPPPLWAVKVRVVHACGPPTNSTTHPATGSPRCNTPTETACTQHDACSNVHAVDRLRDMSQLFGSTCAHGAALI